MLKRFLAFLVFGALVIPGLCSQFPPANFNLEASDDQRMIGWKQQALLGKIFTNGIPVTAVITNATITTSTNVSSMVAGQTGKLDVNSTNSIPAGANFIGFTATTNAAQSSIAVTNLTGDTLATRSDTVSFNQLLDIDVTAAGIAAGDVLAPVVTFAGVNRTSGAGVQLQQLTVFNRDDANLSFSLLITKQALSSWGATNAVAYVPDVDDTNILDVISSADGTWTDLGTNRFWSYRPVGGYYFPLTTNLFIYSINTAAITNTKPGRISAKFFKD